MYLVRIYVYKQLEIMLYYSDLENAILDMLNGTMFDFLPSNLRASLSHVNPKLTFSDAEYIDVENPIEFTYTDDVYVCIGRIVTEESKR